MTFLRNVNVETLEGAVLLLICVTLMACWHGVAAL
jgi:hypothetical protein